ncbi:MAG: hypothetical protein VX447_16075 [Pseudomonadota bacterium]|uniref:hypothetical protein n=1 Tax=Gallaecimonas pentaromativorans TaxID=584787 RepID=UPI0012EE767D|nr:hypothetical protein [Gallaecimonas pentaromativorans]MED5526252.1 hypothetical protein [Pseudomonadota bacterium]
MFKKILLVVAVASTFLAVPSANASDDETMTTQGRSEKYCMNLGEAQVCIQF